LLVGVVSAQNQVACEQFDLYCDTQAHPVGTKVQLLLRPEDIAVVAPTATPTNLLQATIVKIEHLGSVVRAHVISATGLTLKVDISKRDFEPALHAVSQAITLTIAPADIRLFAQ
jgi:ABC-type Fe3+/spermidine/putrescine transport system ATPase subunit